MLLMEKRREIFISCPNTIDIWSLGDANIWKQKSKILSWHNL
jgi:hypothetical protein